MLQITICNPLWKNQPLAIFHENRVLGMDRRRIYCRVQRSKSQVLKRLLSRVMAKKLYTGHPCLSLQFFEKQIILYVRSSTFNVSVYALYYTTRFVSHNEFAGKDVHRRSASTAVLVLKRRYREKRWTLRFVSCL